jgi:hypothetical protein
MVFEWSVTFRISHARKSENPVHEIAVIFKEPELQDSGILSLFCFPAYRVPEQWAGTRTVLLQVLCLPAELCPIDDRNYTPPGRGDDRDRCRNRADPAVFPDEPEGEMVFGRLQALVEKAEQVTDPVSINVIDKVGQPEDPGNLSRGKTRKAGKFRIYLPYGQFPVKRDDSRSGMLEEGSVTEFNLLQALLSLMAAGSFADLMIELCKLGFWVPAFLDIIRGTVVNGFDHDLLPSTAGEKNKRYGTLVLFEDLQKTDAIGPGHLVVGDDHIKKACFEKAQGVGNRARNRDGNIGTPFKVDLGNVQESGFVIHIQH